MPKHILFTSIFNVLFYPLLIPARAVDKNEEEMIMRKMKTIMSLAAAAALAGVLLTGCSTEAG